MENTCNFVGFVRHLSGLNESSKGNRYCRFTLENINHGHYNYIQMVIFGKNAEKYSEEISEGDFIYVNCEMQISIFEGQVRYSFMLRDYHTIDLDDDDKDSSQERSTETHTKSRSNEKSDSLKRKKITDAEIKKAYDETFNSKTDEKSTNDSIENEKVKSLDGNAERKASNNDFFDQNHLSVDKDDDDFFNNF